MVSLKPRQPKRVIMITPSFLFIILFFLGLLGLLAISYSTPVYIALGGL